MLQKFCQIFTKHIQYTVGQPLEHEPESAKEAPIGVMYPGTRGSGRKLRNRSGTNQATGSATSDEHVLKGAYGGHIIMIHFIYKIIIWMDKEW